VRDAHAPSSLLWILAILGPMASLPAPTTSVLVKRTCHITAVLHLLRGLAAALPCTTTCEPPTPRLVVVCHQASSSLFPCSPRPPSGALSRPPEFTLNM
jgi:hypothetical protein